MRTYNRHDKVIVTSASPYYVVGADNKLSHQLINTDRHFGGDKDCAAVAGKRPGQMGNTSPTSNGFTIDSLH